MFLLATSQGLTAYENFYANRIYDDPEFYTLHHTAEPTIIISSIDILGLSLQIVTWHHAKVQYSKTVGSAPLEQRFRMANVYKWTLTLFPSSIFAVIVKTFSIGMIWIYITQEKYDLENGYRSLYFVFVFKNLQAAYAISLPFIILSTNSQLCRKFRAKFCGAKRKVSPKTVKTLEGKEIRRNFRTTAEYFENLRNGWEKF
ncbi:unnamed protein product [Caenorhabditis angaria]|uniref:7TM GPCR serpentine receptor class x (Srx) domain-containing protein n=1 Tax=Caenorhabditis angaria TaxID=860376 RepID=A0A9P1J4P7_9PELO|nr:unnamed protein product [Caenorhabditis angaria]